MPALRRAFFVTALTVAASIVIVRSYQRPPDGSASATYSQGTLRVNLPYAAPHAGAGRLIVEVLDPEDTAIGRTEERVELDQGKGTWQQEVKLSKPLAFEDLIWHRLRYRFTYSDSGQAPIQGTESLSQI